MHGLDCCLRAGSEEPASADLLWHCAADGQESWLSSIWLQVIKPDTYAINAAKVTASESCANLWLLGLY